MLKSRRGITLIALVITIIVLLILAGVTIAMLSGENGILSRGTETRATNAEAQADEQAKLAYMGVRTEIIAERVSNASYNAQANTGKLAGKVRKELKDKWTVTPSDENDTSGTITMTFEDTSLNKTNHQIVYTIILPGVGDSTVTLKKDGAEMTSGNSDGRSESSSETNDVYRGLATESDVHPDIFNYEIITQGTASIKEETKIASTGGIKLATTSTPGTAKITGINLEYILSDEVFNGSTYTDEHLIAAVKNFIDGDKLVIPHGVKLDSDGKYSSSGQNYEVTEVESLYGYANGLGTGGLPSVGLKSVIYPEGIVNIGEEYGYYFGSGGSGLFSDVSTVSLPTTLRVIEDGAFDGFSSLEKLTIPSGVDSIHVGALDDCPNLRDVSSPAGILTGGVSGYDCWPSSVKNLVLVGNTIGFYEFFYLESGTKIMIDSEALVQALYNKTLSSDFYVGTIKIKNDYYDSSKQVFFAGGTDEYSRYPYIFKNKEDGYAVYERNSNICEASWNNEQDSNN